VRARGGGWTLSPSCRACVAVAAELAGGRRIAAVVFTGYAPGGGRSEAEQMRDAWRGPVDVELVLEPQARNTAENAARTLPLLRERGIEEAVVVCSRLHRARVRFFFSHVYRKGGIGTAIVPVAVRPSSRALLRELAALPLALAQRRRIR